MPSITEIIYRPQNVSQQQLRRDRIDYCNVKAKLCLAKAETGNPMWREYYQGLASFWLEHANLARKGF